MKCNSKGNVIFASDRRIRKFDVTTKTITTLAATSFLGDLDYLIIDASDILSACDVLEDRDVIVCMCSRG